MAVPNSSQALTVLLIEDDVVDAEGIVRSMKKSGANVTVEVVSEGQQALDRLRGANGVAQVERPFLILLDLNLPKMTGHDFLDALRHDSQLSESIVIVYTTSNADSDRSRAYQNNVAAYILKKDVGINHSNIIRLIDFYSEFVQMPT